MAALESNFNVPPISTLDVISSALDACVSVIVSAVVAFSAVTCCNPYDASMPNPLRVRFDMDTLPTISKTLEPYSSTCKLEPTDKETVGAEFAIPTFAVVIKATSVLVNWRVFEATLPWSVIACKVVAMLEIKPPSPLKNLLFTTSILPDAFKATLAFANTIVFDVALP